MDPGGDWGPVEIQLFLEFYTLHSILYLPLQVVLHGQSTFSPLQRLARCLHQLEIMSASEKVSEADCSSHLLFPQSICLHNVSKL